MGRKAAATASELMRLMSSEFRATLAVQFIEPTKVILPSITIALAWAIFTPRSIRSPPRRERRVRSRLPSHKGCPVGDQIDIDAALLSPEQNRPRPPRQMTSMRRARPVRRVSDASGSTIDDTKTGVFTTATR